MRGRLRHLGVFAIQNLVPNQFRGIWEVELLKRG